MWLLAVVMFCCQTGSYGLTFWVPTIVKGLSGYTDFEVGLFSAIPYIAAALGMVLVGSQLGSHRRAIPARRGSVVVRRAGLHRGGLHACRRRSRCWRSAVAAVGDYSTRGPFWALPGKFLAGSAAAGAIALINSMGALGGSIGPSTVGWLRDQTGGFLGPMLMLSGVLVVGAFLTMFLRRSPLLRD